MESKVKKYIGRFISLLMLTFGVFVYDLSAQGPHPLLKVSICNSGERLSPSSVLHIRIENLSQHALSIEQITLSLSPVLEVNSSRGDSRSFFAHVPLKKRKVLKGRSLEIDARMDDRHWFSSNSQTFMYSPQLPNFSERFEKGSFSLFVSVLLPADAPPYYQIFPSDDVVVRVD